MKILAGLDVLPLDPHFPTYRQPRTLIFDMQPEKIYKKLGTSFMNRPSNSGVRAYLLYSFLCSFSYDMVFNGYLK